LFTPKKLWSNDIVVMSLQQFLAFAIKLLRTLRLSSDLDMNQALGSGDVLPHTRFNHPSTFIAELHT
jgi:hypothetical protein